MSKGEKEEKVLALYKELIALQIEENTLSKARSQVKEELSKLIPAGGRIAGVKRTVVETKRVSWKEVAETSKVSLIPKTRWTDYEQFVFANTKLTIYDKYSAGED